MSLNNRIIELQEFLKALDSLINENFLLAGSSVILAIIRAMIWIYKNNNHLFEIFNNFKKTNQSRINDIEKFLQNNDKSEDKFILTMLDFREQHYFKSATGINAEKDLRTSLIKLHEETSNKVTWSRIKKSINYLNLQKDNSIQVRKLDWADSTIYYVSIIFGLISLMACLFLTAISIFYLIFENYTAMLLAAFFAILYFSSSFVFYLGLSPYRSAKLIQKELLELSMQTSIDFRISKLQRFKNFLKR